MLKKKIFSVFVAILMVMTILPSGVLLLKEMKSKLGKLLMQL
ncbi:hypothetical protein [Anaerofustis butyriciformans]